MGNAKIVYTPSSFYSLVIAAANYCTLADDDTLDMSTGDFSLDALIYPTAGTEGVIVAKGATDLTSVNGWRLVMDVTWTRIIFQLNDGDATKFSMVTANDSITLSTWVWVRVEVDRSGNAVIYLNGVAAKTTDVSGYPGSLSNAEGLLVGSADWDGAIGLVRIDKGRILGQTWITQEYDRLRYGCRRLPYDFTEMWTFAQTLTGLSATARALTWAGGGSAAYSTGYPTGTISYTFEQNYVPGHGFPFEELGDIVRAESGAARSYRPFAKQTWDLSFEAITLAQVAAFQGVWLGGVAMNFWPDADLPEYYSVFMVSPPQVSSTELFDATGQRLYELSVELKEV